MDLGLDDFSDLEEIGRGGFGVVFKARQRAFGRTVAIKVLTNADDDTVRCFERERLALGQVSNHPNIVPVYASGLTPAGAPYLAMEYMQGGSLEDNIRHRGPSTWEATVDIGIKLCGALETAHRAGITHRDLKPANVLLSQYGEPHLADFGIASIEGGEHTKSGVITASIHYAPPEVLDGHRPGVAGDVYSLGAMLYSLVAGRAPFMKEGEDTIIALALRVAGQTPPDLRLVGVPDDLATVIERAMSKSAAHRYPTAEALGRALQQVQLAHGLRQTALPVESAPPDLANATTRFEAPAPGSQSHQIAPPLPATPVSPLSPGSSPPPVISGPYPPLGVTPSGAPSRSRGGLIAAGVAVAALLGGAVVYVATRDGDGVTVAAPEPTEASTEQATEAASEAATEQATETASEAATEEAATEAATEEEATEEATEPATEEAGPAAPVAESPLAAGPWQDQAPMLLERQQTNAVVTASGRIWVTGGLNPLGASLRSVESYDAATGWADCGCDLPQALNHHATALWQGRPVVIGGWIGDEEVPAGGQPELALQVNLETYMLGNDGWETLAPIPVPKVGALAVTVGDRIVVIGGQDGGATGGDRLLQPSTLVFDGQVWTEASPLPTPREHVAGATDGRFVYVVGGRPLPGGAAENMATLERYDPASDTWERLADMPTARSDLAAVWANGYLIALGGESATGTYDAVEVYDPATDTWASLPALAPARHGAAAVYYQSEVWIMGGAPEQGHNLSVDLVQSLGLTVGL
jgi:non-specific serine/threonine protein kinase